MIREGAGVMSHVARVPRPVGTVLRGASGRSDGRFHDDTQPRFDSVWISGVAVEHGHDGESSRTYDGAQPYDPVLGRFLAAYASGQFLLPHAYAGQTLLSMVDPGGRHSNPRYPFVVLSGDALNFDNKGAVFIPGSRSGRMIRPRSTNPRPTAHIPTFQTLPPNAASTVHPYGLDSASRLLVAGGRQRKALHAAGRCDNS